MTGRFKPARIAGICAGLVMVVAGMLGFSASAYAETVTFKYTGKEQEFKVPEGVSSITVDARGAAGGESGGSDFNHAVGGMGARVQGTVAVTAGETLQINVGGQGGTEGNQEGGWNGGGYGGANGEHGDSYQVAGGGGGASDLRHGSDTLAERLLVAAGGGGGGGYGSGTGPGGLGGASGGAGGGSSSDGTEGESLTDAYGGGPGLAGQGSGGEGGAGVCEDGTSGGGGELGLGGNGGGSTSPGGNGGGGGGGYYGGGAGGGGGGGGNGCVIPEGAGGGGGGGGSNYTGAASSVTVTDGYQSGNGQVTITYTAPVTGATGPTGPTGPEGPSGPTGASGSTGPQGVTGATGAQGPTGPTGPAGTTGPPGVTGATGATGPTGPQGATGPAGSAAVATFASSQSVPNGNCLNYTMLAGQGNGYCPAKTPGFSLSPLLAGMPENGGHVSNLYAETNAAVSGSDTATVTVIDNTSGVALLSCTVTSTSKGVCSNAATAATAAAPGDRLEVQVTNTSPRKSWSCNNKEWSVRFRY